MYQILELPASEIQRIKIQRIINQGSGIFRLKTAGYVKSPGGGAITNKYIYIGNKY